MLCSQPMVFFMSKLRYRRIRSSRTRLTSHVANSLTKWMREEEKFCVGSFRSTHGPWGSFEWYRNAKISLSPHSNPPMFNVVLLKVIPWQMSIERERKALCLWRVHPSIGLAFVEEQKVVWSTWKMPTSYESLRCFSFLFFFLSICATPKDVKKSDVRFGWKYRLMYFISESLTALLGILPD